MSFLSIWTESPVFASIRCTIASFCLFILPIHSDIPKIYDVIVYGGTSAGVTAAVQAGRMKKSVLLISPDSHLGGMTSSGLGWVDVGKPHTIGGLTREIFHNIWLYYQNPIAWVWESKRTIQGQLMKPPKGEVLWVTEPHVAEQIFNAMAEDARIDIVFQQRLDRTNGVRKLASRIVSIEMESGLEFTGRIFIDATYEGDLMASAGVSYSIGRENNKKYGEVFNGANTQIRINLPSKKIDPYKIRGVPSSGLLQRVFIMDGYIDEGSDICIQAYNYRMCLTDVPENRVWIEKPEDYDPSEYELVFRALEAGFSYKSFFKLDLLPNRKTDSNNNGLVSTDYIGMNWNYPEADYDTREKIAKAHERWQKGLIWTLQNHPDIPAHVRKYYASWGLPRDEFIDNNHWPYQLYIREARRMVGSSVVTEHTAFRKEPVPDPIGISSYQMDSHYVKYIVHDGHLTTEGGVYRHVPDPFQIGYGAIIPRKKECENLIVPVCISASHTGYGSVRMEPVYMILGQSAGTAASLCVDLNIAVQDLPYEKLKKSLLEAKQVISLEMK